ncbi:MAG: hypothetical protein AUH75_11000 [Gemmatimonadetes bacterium 13_1_40CM_4_65_7]|nr:MAG: hypothetical protein AUH75_11000 [Gemmatimonadetes bacterium 13_1_40CM_4_65_7]
MALPPIETPQERVRTALHLLDELEHELGVVGLIVPQRYHLVRVLSAMRRQLWLTVATLESSRGAGKRAWRRRGGGSVLSPLTVVASVGRVVAVLLRSAWQSAWGVVRLARTLRAL